jgi:rubredoxin
MNTYVLVSRKDRMKCPVCGDLRIGRKKAPARYRGKMKYNEAKGKMVCDVCDFEFAFSELKPKKEFFQAVAAMDLVADLPRRK